MTCEDCILYSWCCNQHGDTDHFDTYDDTYTDFEVEKECTGFISNELYLMHPYKIGTPVYYIETKFGITNEKTTQEFCVNKGTYAGKMFDENKTLKYIVLTEATSSALMTDNIFIDKVEAEIIKELKERESNR